VIRHGPGWSVLLLRVVVANGAMIAVLLWLHKAATWWMAANLEDRVSWLSLSVVAGAGVYFVALVVLGLRPNQFRLRHD